VFEQIDFFMENVKVFDARSHDTAKALYSVEPENRAKLSSCLIRVEHDKLPSAMHLVENPNDAEQVLVSAQSALKVIFLLKQEQQMALAV
jgi:hypothetical protein